MYPRAFQDGVPPGYKALLNQVYDCVNNTKRESHDSASTTSAGSSSSTSAGPSSSKTQKQTSKDRYGCIQWNCDLPSDETEDSQLEKKNWMKSESFIACPDSKKVANYMSLTYASQRSCINNPNVPISVVLEEWPFLKEPVHLFEHFETLTGTSATEYDETATGRNKGQRIYRYMCSVAEKKGLPSTVGG